MKKSVKSALTATGIFLAAGAASVAATYLTTKILVKIALDRDEPDFAKKASDAIAGKAVDADFLKELNSAAEKIEKEPHETVNIISFDGTRLVGHWFPSENAERVIIAMHGWRSTWARDFGTVADFWAKNNCSVLYAEQRAQNNSEGEYMGFGLTERYDCLEWIKWATDKCGKDLPIYLCGVSMGATTVLMASGLDLPENVHGIMADCGFTSPHAIWKHVSNNNLHLPYWLRGIFADGMFRQKINMGTRDYSTVEALKNNYIPVMLIHGTDDHFVPVNMTYENYLACAGEKRLLIVPGADHGMSHYTEPEKYEAEAKRFWKDFDSKKPKKKNSDGTPSQKPSDG